MLNMWDQILIRNSVIHYWREYLRYLYYKSIDIWYSVCATIFVQISVTENFINSFFIFLSKWVIIQFNLAINWTETYQLGKVFLN